MNKLNKLGPLSLRSSRQLNPTFNWCRMFSDDETPKSKVEPSPDLEKKKKKRKRPMYSPTPQIPLRLEDLEEPTNCCMSGCANCVWIDYAEKLSIFMKNSPGHVQKVLMEKVQDPNMRAFLSMELRVRKIIE
ncbi:oxidoreductase-like domain-containing protein 1 [Trichogramma pretiosum]|uniref:oxidoreductase-like domain-containing protein 1 n=1 Tax=Trichogramma pretiosum TaxID=7493 RepID=UPI0006C9B73E|nr:oxidoreductase-like domain-containing protein 1 [Trichogramma pretiosum]